MERKITCLEVRSPSGELLFSVRLVEADPPKNETTESRPSNGHHNGNGTSGGNGQRRSSSAEAMMSDAQKRYIFRLLAEQGYEGDAAYLYLMKACEVSSLAEITKQEASGLIERMLETKGAKKNGSSIPQSN
jgi:hypothetical protein